LWAGSECLRLLVPRLESLGRVLFSGCHSQTLEFGEEISHGTCLILDNRSTVVTDRKASSPLVPRPRSSLSSPSYLLRTPTRSDDWSGSAIEVVEVPGFPNECFETIATL
jgi:hypothetical protein